MFRALTLFVVMAMVVAISGMSPSAGGDDKPKDKAAARNFEVTYKGNKIDQANIAVVVGDTVRWVNEDNGQHSVTFDTAGAPWTEKIVEGGAFTERAKFTTAGEFKYHCKFHQTTMTGTVTVK